MKVITGLDSKKKGEKETPGVTKKFITEIHSLSSKRKDSSILNCGIDLGKCCFHWYTDWLILNMSCVISERQPLKMCLCCACWEGLTDLWPCHYFWVRRLYWDLVLWLQFSSPLPSWRSFGWSWRGSGLDCCWWELSERSDLSPSAASPLQHNITTSLDYHKQWSW